MQGGEDGVRASPGGFSVSRGADCRGEVAVAREM